MAEINSGSVYHITNAKATGNAMDLSGTDQRHLIGWPSHEGDNQKWHIEKVGDHYTIRNVRYGKYIGLEAHPENNVSAVAVEQDFKWNIVRDKEDPSVYRFFVPGTRFNLDLTNHGSDKGDTPIAIWGAWEGRNQCWSLRQRKHISLDVLDVLITYFGPV
ncbi:carbohydrate-binding module family 13 protein [Amanita rubescens]|nr:carbohydrate-binding module family 13 protein [Amanita rubescens]